MTCTYCRKPCDGSKRDEYGEFMLKVPLVVCDECAEDFEDELGPWSEWN